MAPKFSPSVTKGSIIRQLVRKHAGAGETFGLRLEPPSLNLVSI
jgi:hypothetical protein